MKPALILAACAFILVMLLSGCVAVPYPEPVVYRGIAIATATIPIGTSSKGNGDC